MQRGLTVVKPWGWTDEVYVSLIYPEYTRGVHLVWRVLGTIGFIHVVNAAEKELHLTAYRVARQLLILVHIAAKKHARLQPSIEGFPLTASLHSILDKVSETAHS